MKTFSALCIAGILILSFVAGCIQKEIAFSVSLLEENQMETEFVVKSGDTFRIELKSNPTTGYEWFVKYDEMMLRLKRSEYISPQSQKMVGSPGKQVFIFQALKKGETIVEFTYKRSWEKDKPPVKIMKCRVMSK